MNKVEIFTDGACKGNPGPGGWGAILRYDETEKEIYGASKNTTNNIMEMTAVIESLRNIKKPCELIITTDSKYVKNGITNWIHNWKKNGWKTAAKKEAVVLRLETAFKAVDATPSLKYRGIRYLRQNGFAATL